MTPPLQPDQNTDVTLEAGKVPVVPGQPAAGEHVLTDAELYHRLMTGFIPDWLKNKNVESRVLPTKDFTFARAEELRQQSGADIAFTYDFHPWGATKDQIDDMKAHPENHPAIDHSDHHSFSAQPRAVGNELTTTEILLDKLDDPSSKFSQALEKNQKILMLTPQMNFDPDGFISNYIVKYPSIAKAKKDLLINAARFTDYEVFGSRKYDENYRLEDEPQHVRVGYALMQLINDQKALLVEREVGHTLNDLTDGNGSHLDADASRALIREQFLAKFTPESVQNMFDAIHQELPLIFEDPDEYLHTTKADEKIVGRLKSVTEYAKVHTKLDKELLGLDKEDDQGFVAVYDAPDRADILYTQKPGTTDRVYDWLSAGAGTSGLMTDKAPLHLAAPVDKEKGTYVFSVPYATQKKSGVRYDARPLMTRLNELEPNTWGGRAEVVLNYRPTKLTTKDIAEEARKLRAQIEVSAA